VRRAACFLFLLCLGAGAAAQGAVRYVGDELAITLREGPGTDTAARGVVVSGMKVQVLERDAASGYARVRTPDNREGWVLERYLKDEPIARDRVEGLEKELAAAQAELKKLREDHARLLQDFARISGGQPVASRELVAETQKMREQLERNEREVAAARARYDTVRASQRTLLLGGGLVGAGVLLALLLRWLWPKRRWGDL
jgi:SH3 domain protein